MYGLYLFPHEIGIGRFQPYGRYTWPEQQFRAREETEIGMNYIISGLNARISAFWRNGDLATAHKDQNELRTWQDRAACQSFQCGLTDTVLRL